MRKTSWLSVVVTIVAGCGGSAEPPPDHAGAGATTTPQATSETSPAEQVPMETAAGEQAETQPAAPQATPIVAESADAVRAALAAAVADATALVRMIDPERGIGTWDRGEGTKLHFCDVSRSAREPALGFEIREGDEWRCDEELTRCSTVDPADHTGTVFHFTKADGGTGRWLESIIVYDRRVPRFDTEDVTAWVRAGAGVCGLYGALTGGADALQPEKITIFVSRLTEGAEASSTDFKCGDEAVVAARERLGPLMQSGPPTSCNRDPQSCAWIESDETRVYGRDGTPYAIALLATNLNEGPARLQEREVAAVADRARNRRCQ